jgi:hypothetical protein
MVKATDLRSAAGAAMQALDFTAQFFLSVLRVQHTL